MCTYFGAKTHSLSTARGFIACIVLIAPDWFDPNIILEVHVCILYILGTSGKQTCSFKKTFKTVSKLILKSFHSISEWIRNETKAEKFKFVLNLYLNSWKIRAFLIAKEVNPYEYILTCYLRRPHTNRPFKFCTHERITYFWRLYPAKSLYNIVQTPAKS